MGQDSSKCEPSPLLGMQGPSQDEGIGPRKLPTIIPASMEQIWTEIRSFLHRVAQRLAQVYAEAPPGSLQVTGVLGLAAVLFGLYRLKSPARRKGELSTQGPAARGTSGASSSTTQNEPQLVTLSPVPTPRPAGPSQAKSADLLRARTKEPSWAVRSKLPGVKSLTLSLPGVLLEEWTPAELQEAATLREDAATVLREIMQICAVYLIAQVEDDLGEATCRGALEAGGLVGTGPSQLPPHRVLFCSSLEGKVSIVRQLEPQLHIDGHPQTIEDLKRFIKLVHVRAPGAPAAGHGSSNVGFAHSLQDLFVQQR